MTAQRFTTATVTGGITMFVLGYVFWGVLFMDFFMANTGSATGVMKEVPVWWALGLGQLGWAALLTYVIGKGAAGVGPGMKVGAVVLLLAAVGVDFTMLGTANLMNLTATILDMVLFTVVGGIAGAVIGWMLARDSGTAAE
jgi:hypothetical protein